ncbi:MAG: peptide ABC transporter substrate-binding protein, partial [Gammaproteobacteria bacterium]|nr:peptide ABC transporter substrate-binding protein [Gammaproteobacteria bacterium]
WYEQMSRLPNGPARQTLIDNMVTEVQQDAPWIWGFYPISVQLSQQWVVNSYPNPLINNKLKYMAVLPEMRYQARLTWNQIALWPITCIFLMVMIFIIGAMIAYRRLNQRKPFVLPKED